MHILNPFYKNILSLIQKSAKLYIIWITINYFIYNNKDTIICMTLQQMYAQECHSRKRQDYIYTVVVK